jgi:hypothetical protein
MKNFGIVLVAGNGIGLGAKLLVDGGWTAEDLVYVVVCLFR